MQFSQNRHVETQGQSFTSLQNLQKAFRFCDVHIYIQYIYTYYNNV